MARPDHGEMAMNKVILDISRLISRIRHRTPSGVDRVEMAYARGLMQRFGAELGFAAVHPFGWKGRLSPDLASAYLDALEQSWKKDAVGDTPRALAEVVPELMRLRPRAMTTGPANGQAPVYVQVSPHHLANPATVRTMLKREQAAFLCMVHDLIPIEFPEYARPSGAALHHQRMRTVAELADAVIVNSAATGRSFAAFAEATGRKPAIHVALLGTEALPPAGPEPMADDRPYFICVGTIEPRKNHLLLLHLWRRMAETMEADAIPRLIIAGRRGWENEQVLDLLERCPALEGHVVEINGCSDLRLAGLIRHARALLMPSFAEGFGMPIAEALSVGVPVICSDIPSHREVGGDAPDYRDQLDGTGWMAAICDHAGHHQTGGGPLADAQRARMERWQAPTWDDHMEIAADVIERLASR
jgi:glycosyltransferase involved in cell wall biosynthesis